MNEATQGTARALFSEIERAAARKIMDDERLGSAHERLLKEIVEPAMPRINQATGQENSPKYMAYCLEYWCDK